MAVRAFVLAGLLGSTGAEWGQAPAPTSAPVPAPDADPFYLPPEAHAFAQQVTGPWQTTPMKLKAFLRALFLPKENGGLGIVYDNSRTRTVEEVWREGKANCLSMTAFFVMSVRSLGIRDQFAEALNTNHWRKVGSIINFERHVVALTPTPPQNDLIADFVPELRRRYGTYLVAVLPENRFKALFYSNRAVEALLDGDLPAAKAQAQRSLNSDPKSSVGWNVLGVVEAAMGNPGKAEEDYRRAIDLDSKDGAAIGNLETLLREQARFEEAAKYRQMGESVRKKDPYFHAFLAEEALGQGNMEEALNRVRLALKILPKDPDFHLLQARIKLADGDLDGAIKGLEDARRWSDPAERERWDRKLALIQNMKLGSNPIK